VGPLRGTVKALAKEGKLVEIVPDETMSKIVREVSEKTLKARLAEMFDVVLPVLERYVVRVLRHGEDVAKVFEDVRRSLAKVFLERFRDAALKLEDTYIKLAKELSGPRIADLIRQQPIDRLLKTIEELKLSIEKVKPAFEQQFTRFIHELSEIEARIGSETARIMAALRGIEEALKKLEERIPIERVKEEIASVLERYGFRDYAETIKRAPAEALLGKVTEIVSDLAKRIDAVKLRAIGDVLEAMNRLLSDPRIATALRAARDQLVKEIRVVLMRGSFPELTEAARKLITELAEHEDILDPEATPDIAATGLARVVADALRGVEQSIAKLIETARESLKNIPSAPYIIEPLEKLRNRVANAAKLVDEGRCYS